MTHQKVITLTYLDSSFLAYTSSKSRDSFITSYCSFHNLDAIPSRSIHPLTNTHTSATDRDTELLLHTKSLQSNKNKGLQTFQKAIEGIIIMPSSSFEKQIEENNKEIALKKLSNEISLGKTTDNTAMELDAEGGTSFEQLQELIRKECDKRDKKYRSLEQKYNKLQESVDQSQQQKNMPMRGPRGTSNKKKSQPSNQRRTANQRGRTTSRRRPRPPTGRNGKAEGTNNDATSDNLEKKKGAGAHDRNRRKGLPTQIGTSHDKHRKQIKTTIRFRR